MKFNCLGEEDRGVQRCDNKSEWGMLSLWECYSKKNCKMNEPSFKAEAEHPLTTGTRGFKQVRFLFQHKAHEGAHAIQQFPGRLKVQTNKLVALL